MKPQKLFEGSIESTLDGYEIEMGLDDSAEGRAHLISLMTDLYSDPILAVIREYSTNARDSHIEADNPDPIEVTLPSSLNPYFTVTDHGVGLSVQDLERVYSRYGASTKRGSDSVNGMLGLGGKSALTYSNQFTVTATKGSVRAQIVVTRNEDGIGVMEVVDTRAANTEGNGVTIRVPVKSDDVNKFQIKADQFFKYWQPGTVKVNGRIPEFIGDSDNVVKVSDTVFIVSTGRAWNDRVNHDVIVMGNVPYETEGKPFTDSCSNDSYAHYTVVFAPMGAITFAPSRESVGQTSRTASFIERTKNEINDSLGATVSAQLQNAGSFQEAFDLWRNWVGVIGSKNMPSVTYKGNKFEEHVRAPHSFIHFGGGRYNSRLGDYGNARRTADHFALSEAFSDHAIIVTGYLNVNAPTGNAARRVDSYIETLSNSDDIKKVYFFNSRPGAPWTNDVDMVEWDTISKIELPKVVGAIGGRTGTIPVQKYAVDDHRWKDTTTIDQNKVILYDSPVEWRDNAYMLSRLRTINKVVPLEIVSIGRNRWDKFVRENPTAKRAARWLRDEAAEAVKAKMTKDELFALGHDEDYRSLATTLTESVTDPTFATLKSIRLDKMRVAAYTNSVVETNQKQLHKDYPLLRYFGVSGVGKVMRHAALYINAVYNERNTP